MIFTFRHTDRTQAERVAATFAHAEIVQTTTHGVTVYDVYRDAEACS